MKRRHRRVLFNVFAFLLLGFSVYLNKYKINNDGASLGAITKASNKATDKPANAAKTTVHPIQKN